jgi:Peptidase family M23
MLALLLATALTVQPNPVYIERIGGKQAVNCDLIIASTAAAPLDIDEIELSVFDRAGKLVLRRFVDGNGTRPSIRTIDAAEVPAQSQVLVFNPFHTFDAEADLASMMFVVKLSTKDGKTRERATVTVHPRHYAGKAKLILPVKGRQIVYDGHDFYAHHRRWDTTIPGLRQLGFRTNFMRYSFDFVPVDENGNMSRGDEEKNENWFGFGRELRAAADGTVVAVVDAHPDDRKFSPAMVAERGPMAIWGNYLVIDHGAGEFSLYGHIKQGSGRVKAGQRVRRGEVVAAIGASGSSKFPHLHYELQTGPDTNAEGLPATFHDFERLYGSRRVRVRAGSVDSGDLLDGR